MDAVPLPAAVRRAGICAVLHLRHMQGLHPDDPAKTKPEDVDTELEDHAADEWRYMCMSRPVAPILREEKETPWADPLNQYERK